MRKRRVFAVAFLGCLACSHIGHSSVLNLPLASFGFLNDAGDHLLGLESTASSVSHTIAICNSSTVRSIKFVGNQKSGPNDSGRQTKQNFAQSPGPLFLLETPVHLRADSCLMTDSDFLKGKKFLTIEEPPIDEWGTRVFSPPSQELINRMATAKGRNVVDSWELGNFPGGQIVVVEFERKEKSALASFVLATPTRLIFDDYQAEYDPESTWRVEDGGRFGPHGFQVLFAFQAAGEYGIGLSWTALESIKLSLLQSQGEQFEEIVSSERYVAPE